MRTLLCTALVLLAFAPALAEAKDNGPQISRKRSIEEVNRQRLLDYRERLHQRHLAALEARRKLNATKLHVYYRATPGYIPPYGWSAIQAGWVYPPSYIGCYRRPVYPRPVYPRPVYPRPGCVHPSW